MLFSRFALAVVAAAAVASGCTTAVETRAPYLQSTTPTSVVVAFRLDRACVAEVRYGERAPDHVVASVTPAQEHFVKVDGLAPGAEYVYTVEACGTAFAGPGRFRTAPAPGTPAIRFAAMGDFGTGTDAQRTVAESIRQRGADLVLGLGDIAYSDGSFEEFQDHFFGPMAPMLAEIPMFTAIGNHEYGTDAGQPYLDSLHLPANNPRKTERFYSFDWGHVHFVALDSQCAVKQTGPGTCTRQEQTDWLAQDLAGTRQPFKIVFFHHPPWSSGDHGSAVALRQAWGPLFEQHGVDLVLTGHDHDYERTRPLKGTAVAKAGEPGAVTYLVIGTGSADPRGFDGKQPAWSAFRHPSALGYLDVTVRAGKLDARLVDPAGKVLDSFQIDKTLPPGTPRSAGEMDTAGR